MKSVPRDLTNKEVIDNPISRPMKAAVIGLDQLQLIEFPVFVQPKLDGIRCMKLNGRLLSSSFKPIKNRFINETLTDLVPNGFDGELILKGGRAFNEISSAVATIKGEPDYEYCVFDYVKETPRMPWHKRLDDLRAWFDLYPRQKNTAHSEYEAYIQELNNRVKMVQTHVAKRRSEVLALVERFIVEDGYEGAILRGPMGPYKSGRSSISRQYLMKIKPFIDDEATVVGFVEQQTNNNAPKIDEIGRAKRSSHKAGKDAAGTLGALVLQDKAKDDPMWGGERFHVGTGISAKLRDEIWRNKDFFLGKLVKYKFQPHGSLRAPRHPVFIGFRDPDDL